MDQGRGIWRKAGRGLNVGRLEFVPLPLTGAGDGVDGGVGELDDLGPPPRLRRLLLLQETHQTLDRLHAHRHTLLISLGVREALGIWDVKGTPEINKYSGHVRDVLLKPATYFG